MSGHDFVFPIALVAAVTAIALIARRYALPYPIAFVIGGGLLALVPWAPHVTLEPDLIFVLILPPLLFSGGWGTDMRAFRENLRAITLLAVGLVVATTALVAVVVHALVPSLGWPAAFVLGAIVSPPDAVAASAVFERFSVPARVLAVLDGEGLVNDATALVIYGFAVEAVDTGMFSPGAALAQFALASVGGVLLGLACGWGAVRLLQALHENDLSDTTIDGVLALLLPYGVYLAGGAAHVSAVLATVVAGMYVSRRSSEIYVPEGRLIVAATWKILIFLLNAVAFLLIGLGLRSLMPDAHGYARQLGVGVAVSVTVVVVRMAWVFPAAFLPRALVPAIRRKETAPSPRAVFVVGWSGMRGVVSLAAALALPITMRSGAAFPGRDAIVFTTFCVIFVTLVGQGVSLEPILRLLKLDGEDLERREVEVRVAALQAGIARVRELEPGFATVEAWEIAGRVLAEYEYRIAHLRGRLDPTVESPAIALDHELQHQALKAEHDAVLRMRDAGEIPDEIFRRIRYDLDLADARLDGG